jgi:biopolymer transport protein ExbB
MHISERFLAFALLGAEWVLWLLIGLSVFSIAIMFERGWFYFTRRIDFQGLADDLSRLLAAKNFGEARSRVQEGDAAEMVVLRAGLAAVGRGVDAVAEAMASRKSKERVRLERNLAFLGTLGNNTPFIGLFGTVLGILKAFHDLNTNPTGGMGVIMSSLSEALVATAVGLLVAIPAVVGFNIFNRRVRATIANVDALAHLVLGALKGESLAEERKATGGKEKASLSEVK